LKLFFFHLNRRTEGIPSPVSESITVIVWQFRFVSKNKNKVEKKLLRKQVIKYTNRFWDFKRFFSTLFLFLLTNLNCQTITVIDSETGLGIPSVLLFK
jgi:hypothetical protein